jgi:outer membrane protein OmpA-like peptidoglycan-associated protein
MATCFVMNEVVAGDYNFSSDADDMIQKLTKKAPAKTRSFAPRTRSFGATRSYGSSQKARSIKIMKRNDAGNMEEEKITVRDDESKSAVNLKIEFNVNSYALKNRSIDTLDELGVALNNDALRQRKIIINGHTDSDGSRQTNLKLSLNRAEAVKRFLVQHHSISSSRIRTMGYGEGMPMVLNNSRRNKQINRRVEIVAKD